MWRRLLCTWLIDVSEDPAFPIMIIHGDIRQKWVFIDTTMITKMWVSRFTTVTRLWLYFLNISYVFCDRESLLRNYREKRYTGFLSDVSLVWKNLNYPQNEKSSLGHTLFSTLTFKTFSKYMCWNLVKFNSIPS